MAPCPCTAPYALRAAVRLPTNNAFGPGHETLGPYQFFRIALNKQLEINMQFLGSYVIKLDFQKESVAKKQMKTNKSISARKSN